MHILFKVKSKETIIRLIDIRSILITYIDCFYLKHAFVELFSHGLLKVESSLLHVLR